MILLKGTRTVEPRAGDVTGILSEETMRQEETAMIDLYEFIDELSKDEGPLFQIDLATGRIFRRGKHRHDWEIHEEAKK